MEITIISYNVHQIEIYAIKNATIEFENMGNHIYLNNKPMLNR